MDVFEFERQLVRIYDTVALPNEQDSTSPVVRYGLRRQGNQLVPICYVRSNGIDYGYPLTYLEKA
jgi:hypothetical protein